MVIFAHEVPSCRGECLSPARSAATEEAAQAAQAGERSGPQGGRGVRGMDLRRFQLMTTALNVIRAPLDSSHPSV